MLLSTCGPQTGMESALKISYRPVRPVTPDSTPGRDHMLLVGVFL